MKIHWIYITVTWVAISSVTPVILAYNTSIILYLLIVVGLITTLIWSYFQYRESETIRLKIEQIPDPDNPKGYVFSIPYSKYRKKYPMISMVDEQYQWCLGAPSEITKDGTIIFKFENKLESDRFILIK